MTISVKLAALICLFKFKQISLPYYLNMIRKATLILMVKLPVLIIFISLFIFSSCPLRQTINSFLNNTETWSNDPGKARHAKIVLMANVQNSCSPEFDSYNNAINTPNQQSNFKSPFLFLSLFAPAVKFVWLDQAKVPVLYKSGHEIVLSTYPIHIRNCLFLI